MENWSSGKEKSFEKNFGEMECAFQAKCWWTIDRPICLLASGRGSFFINSNDCVCRKDICPIFQTWKNKGHQKKGKK